MFVFSIAREAHTPAPGHLRPPVKGPDLLPGRAHATEMARPTRARATTMAAAALVAVLAAAAGIAPANAAAPTSTPLSMGPWRMANKNGSLDFSDVALPSYPHQILQSKGVIGDPLYRYNEMETRWVCDDAWTYSRAFEASAQQAGAPAADLVFKGIDTFATVTLNGEVILRTDNFHRTWRVPVQGLLRAGGNNTLTIAIEPAEATAIRLKEELPYTVNALHQPGGMDIYNYARKGAYSFGWGEFRPWLAFRRVPARLPFSLPLILIFSSEQHGERY